MKADFGINRLAKMISWSDVHQLSMLFSSLLTNKKSDVYIPRSMLDSERHQRTSKLWLR